MLHRSIAEQIAIIMDGTEFGDTELERFMRLELEKRLVQAIQEKRRLRVYCGYDVTGPDLHLGHTVTLRKLRQFQDLGHETTFVIGTFTSLIGDPSDRETSRKPRDTSTILRESKLYAQQAFKILDPQKTHIKFNHEWLTPLRLSDFLPIATQFSVQQLLTRENFKRRIEKNDPIPYQEVLYPLAQAYDAVVLRADIQDWGIGTIIQPNGRTETTGILWLTTPNLSYISHTGWYRWGKKNVEKHEQLYRN